MSLSSGIFVWRCEYVLVKWYIYVEVQRCPCLVVSLCGGVNMCLSSGIFMWRCKDVLV